MEGIACDPSGELRIADGESSPTGLIAGSQHRPHGAYLPLTCPPIQPGHACPSTPGARHVTTLAIWLHHRKSLPLGWAVCFASSSKVHFYCLSAKVKKGQGGTTVVWEA